MPDTEIPASLEDIEESLEVAVEIGVWIGNRIPHPCLCGEVHHGIEMLFREQPVQGILVTYIELYEPAGRPSGTDLDTTVPEMTVKTIDGEAAVLEADIVIIVDVVKPHNLVSP